MLILALAIADGLKVARRKRDHEGECQISCVGEMSSGMILYRDLFQYGEGN